MLRWLKRGFILGAAAVAAYVAYTRLKPRPIPVEALHTDGQFVTVEGLQIHYRAAGSGPPLILIHGIGASIFAWRFVFDRLARDYTVYALDLKGHGLSDKPDSGDYSPFGMADLVAHFMDALGIEAAKVIGLSMGGAAGLGLAIRHPSRVEQLVLIGSAGYSFNYHVMPLLIRFARTPLGSAVIGLGLRQRSFITWYLRSCYYEPDRMCTPEAIDGYFLPLLTPGTGGIVSLLARDFGQVSIAHRLKEVQAPTLIVWGQYDALIPLHWGYRFQQDITNAKLVVFPKCGHCPHEEEPQKFLDTVSAFFEGREIPATSSETERPAATHS
jgi:pimeloyl-ACP methyl ester carboxylesterase